MKWLVGGFCGTLVTAAFAHEYLMNKTEAEERNSVAQQGINNNSNNSYKKE